MTDTEIPETYEQLEALWRGEKPVPFSAPPRPAAIEPPCAAVRACAGIILFGVMAFLLGAFWVCVADAFRR